MYGRAIGEEASGEDTRPRAEELKQSDIWKYTVMLPLVVTIRYQEQQERLSLLAPRCVGKLRWKIVVECVVECVEWISGKVLRKKM